jgi:predicted MFS family arabinose efflux permease
LTPHDRRALFAVAGQFFVNGAMTASFIARAPQIRDGLGVTVDRFGLLLTIGAISGIVGSVISGRVIHRASTRRVLQTGAVGMVFALPVIGAAEDPVLWLVALLIYAFFDVLADVSMNLQGSWISARRHAPVMNRLHGLWSLGWLAGGLGAVAANAAGVSPFDHLLAVAAAMAVALIVVTRNLLPRDEIGHADTAPAVVAMERPASRAPVVLLVLAGMFAVLVEVTGGDWAPFRLTDDFAASPALGSLAFVSFSVGMTLMRFVGDSLQLRLGRSVLHRSSLVIATVGFVVASLIGSEAAAIAGFFLVGVGVATLMPKLYDDAARFPVRRGTGLGAMTAGMRVAFLITPVAVGAIAGTDLSVGAAIAIITIPAMIGLAVTTEIADRSRRLQPPNVA